MGLQAAAWPWGGAPCCPDPTWSRHFRVTEVVPLFAFLGCQEIPPALTEPGQGPEPSPGGEAVPETASSSLSPPETRASPLLPEYRSGQTTPGCCTNPVFQVTTVTLPGHYSVLKRMSSGPQLETPRKLLEPTSEGKCRAPVHSPKAPRDSPFPHAGGALRGR